ncbi:hypothetical protein ONS95_012202 [Cadophora gregata]|uniref:uncharacterized protein n=1 Tax=Cadophora gregata TaxID=51156 RepID=UPI0026DC846C|nr:uncharacterized protein ONS95_012202 [Cadophora gregata]KAK0117883.1 hypothetical protein ONS95_012202 [Cadophora gregata]
MLIPKRMLSSIDYSRVPAADPPAGALGNFVDPPTMACSVLEVSLSLSVVSTVFVVARIYTRGRIVKSLQWDDLFLGTGLLLSWVFCALGILEIQYGYGVDIWNVYTTNAISFLKLDLASQAIYHFALLFTKVSILLTLLHSCNNPITSSAFQISVFCLMAFVTLYSLISIFIAIFGCSPMNAAWDIRVDDAKCVNKAAYWLVYAVCNTLSSCAVLGLGFFVSLKSGLFGRSVGIKFRWCLGFVAAVGCFSCVVSIVRLALMVPYMHSENFTRFKVYVARWCEIELNSAIIFSSLFALQPLFTKLLPTLFQPPSFTHCRSRKMSLSTSQPSIPLSRVSSRRNVSLEESGSGLTGNDGIDSGDVSSSGVGAIIGERRVLGGSFGKKNAVIKTVVYDVKYEP